MREAVAFAAVCVVGVVLVASCSVQEPRVPVSVAEYRRSAASGGSVYPRRTIVLHNLQRVLDGELKVEQRLRSQELVTELAGDDASVWSGLAEVLGEADAPPALQEAVLTFLLRNDHPGLARHVVGALTRIKPSSKLRDTLLDWLVRHPTPEVLAEVVKLWAEEVPAGIDEPRFRIVIEKISGKDWDQTLLDGINAEGFFARGSALEVLCGRLSPALLRDRIARMTPKTDAVATLQGFIERFDYLPTNRVEFLAAASIYQKQRKLLDDAARLYAQWQKLYGYSFNIRDSHLLSRMARDPLRKTMQRRQLVRELAQAFASRQHVRATGERGFKYDDRFAVQMDRLTAADLWNLYLLNQMLTTPRNQLALRILAERDRADETSAWGGLIFYQNGRAEAKLYPADGQGGSDLVRAADEREQRDWRDALCRFHGHFEKLYNAGRAGPTADERVVARLNNTYGLVLTSVGEHVFCAHYFTPSGVVVSLGKFPFREGG